MAELRVSLPEPLQRFVKERIESASFTDEGDYIRSLVTEDQQRVAAEKRLTEMISDRLRAEPTLSASELETFRRRYWLRWLELKSEIADGLTSLEESSEVLDDDFASRVGRRGREKLARSQS